ncbi:MAG: hypothetical protein QOG46_2577 [Pseudonocardiales bacterium]|nr:hypothetical protein [Pseudonocardiales bacterium]
MPKYNAERTRTTGTRDDEPEAGEDPAGPNQAALIGELERVLQGKRGTDRTLAASGAAPKQRRDYPAAIELVRGAADFMRGLEERVEETERRLQDIVQRTAQEIRAAEARAEAADARTREAEARADEAERRAREAQEWLDQILTVISDELRR